MLNARLLWVLLAQFSLDLPPVKLLNLAEKLRSGKMTETLQLRGTLRGHNGWVTQITTNPKYPDMILSSSRDKSLIVWKLTRDDQGKISKYPAFKS